MNKQKLKPRRHFDLLELISFVTAKWLIIVILMILGGGIGMGLSFLRPTVYESNAVFGVTIDYTQTGALTDVQEDQAMRGVGNLFLSEMLIEKTLEEIHQVSQVNVSETKFRENAFVDRGDFNWTIRYRSNDPILAHETVQIWSVVAERVIQEAAVHALAAESYLRTMDQLVDCLAQLPQPTVSRGYCGFESSERALDEIIHISRQVQDEKKQSHGLFYALTVYLVEQANLPEEPIRNQTNLLVFSGACICALIGMIFFIFRYFRAGDQI